MQIGTPITNNKELLQATAVAVGSVAFGALVLPQWIQESFKTSPDHIEPEASFVDQFSEHSEAILYTCGMVVACGLIPGLVLNNALDYMEII